MNPVDGGIQKIGQPITEEPESSISMQEIDEVSLYSHFLEGRIYQLSLGAFFRAHYGEHFISVGVLGSEKLEQLRPLQLMPQKDAQCLKQSISNDMLSERTLFSRRKTEYAQCVQQFPLAVMACHDAHSKGLNSVQKKELLNFTPNAIVGAKVNVVMAPFAAVSKIIQVTMKGLYLGAVSNTCAEIDPHNFKQCVSNLREALEGRDPELNRKIVESMPRWVLKAGELMAQGADKLQSLDDFLVEEFRTFPGIVREGVSGIIDVGLPTVAGAAVKTVSKTAVAGVHAVKFATTAVKDAREINQIVSTLFREATKGSMETFSVKPGMNLASKNMTIFNSEHEFANVLAKNVELKNTTEVLPSVAQGKSGSSVYFVQRGDQSLPIVIKDFPGLVSPHSRFGQEIVAYNILRDLNLTHMELPQLLKVGKIRPENTEFWRGLLAMTRVPGKSLAETLEKQALLRGLDRVTQLQENYIASHAIGKAIGELHGRTTTVSLAPSEHIMHLHANRIRDFFNTAEQTLQSYGFSFAFKSQDVERMIADFFKKPGKAGLAHGDAHYGNFIWDSQRKRLAAIDTGSLSQLLNKQGKPAGIQAQDLAGLQVTSEFFARRAGLAEAEVAELKLQFIKGYSSQTALNTHSLEGLRFYECYWRLFVLTYHHQAHEAWMKSIEALNLLFKK